VLTSAGIRESEILLCALADLYGLVVRVRLNGVSQLAVVGAENGKIVLEVGG